MKALALVLYTSLATTTVLSQEFAPLGAKWTYTERNVYFETADNISYSELIVTKDTIIRDRDCVEIEGARFCWLPEGLQYVSTSNDSVYYFDPRLDDFKLIYAFNTPAGGSWMIPILGEDGYMDTLTVTVDSVSTIEINSHVLGVQYVTYYGRDYNKFGLRDSLSYNSEIVEILGDLNFLFLFPVDMSSICDHNYSAGLRCYEDNIIGHYETGIAPNCTYTYVGLNEPKIGTLGLYPNPTSGQVFLKAIPGNIKSFELIDYMGKKVRKYLSSDEFNLDGLSNGVYFLMMIDDQSNYYLERVLKFGN